MSTCTLRRRLATLSRHYSQLLLQRPCSLQRRWLTPAPKPGDGPLMDRRADRELPDIQKVRFRWRRTLPLFLAIVAASAFALFNYQKTSSPIIASTLYALRTSPRAGALLGDDIYFKHAVPWIRGEMNQLHGRFDIAFSVRGSRAAGTMRFVSQRPSSRAPFETTEWSLRLDGTDEWVDLLEARDPFKTLLADEADASVLMEEVVGVAETPRGFRQQGVVTK